VLLERFEVKNLARNILKTLAKRWRVRMMCVPVPCACVKQPGPPAPRSARSVDITEGKGMHHTYQLSPERSEPRNTGIQMLAVTR
jgi:hypothetical protein